jgi:hypothetical protein
MPRNFSINLAKFGVGAVGASSSSALWGNMWACANGHFGESHSYNLIFYHF